MVVLGRAAESGYRTPPPLWLDTIEGEDLDSIEVSAHEIPASQDGWRWVVSRGCRVAVLRGADSYAKMEQEFMSRLYPRRSTF